MKTQESSFIVSLGLDYCRKTGEPFVHADLWTREGFLSYNGEEGPEAGRGSFCNPSQDEVVEMVETILEDRGVSMDDVEFATTDMWLECSI